MTNVCQNITILCGYNCAESTNKIEGHYWNMNDHSCDQSLSK